MADLSLRMYEGAVYGIESAEGNRDERVPRLYSSARTYV